MPDPILQVSFPRRSLGALNGRSNTSLSGGVALDWTSAFQRSFSANPLHNAGPAEQVRAIRSRSMGFFGTISDQPQLRAGLSPRLVERVAGPVKIVLGIIDRWSIGDTDGATVLGAEGGDFISGLRIGAYVLRSRDAQDRVRMVIQIYEGVFSLFEDADDEKRWIRERQEKLEDRSVLALMTQGSFLSLARAQSFVDYINGR